MTRRVLKSLLEDRIDRAEIEKALAKPSDPEPDEGFRKELGL